MRTMTTIALMQYVIVNGLNPHGWEVLIGLLLAAAFLEDLRSVFGSK